MLWKASDGATPSPINADPYHGVVRHKPIRGRYISASMRWKVTANYVAFRNVFLGVGTIAQCTFAR
jgi:hypothetical protein